MKKIFLTLVLAIVCIWQGVAQTVEITGGATGNLLPVSNSEGDYYYSQFIYLGSEINNSGTIESLTFKLAETPKDFNQWNNWKIRLAETSENSYTQGGDFFGREYTPKNATFTEVYNGSITADNTNKTIKIQLSTPFVYDTSKNLLVEVYEQVPSNNGFLTSTYFDVKSTPGTFRGIGKGDSSARTESDTSVVDKGAKYIPAVTIAFASASASTPDATLTYCEGEKVELTSQETADEYKWTKVGESGTKATTKDYVVTNSITSTEDGDKYKLEVIKNGSCTDSYIIELKIKAKPVFTKVEKVEDICSGKPKFTITGTAGATVTYQIGSETEATATIGSGGTVEVSATTDITANTQITVSKIAKDCEVDITTNNTATVALKSLPEVTSFTAENATICGQGDVTFNIVGTPNATVTYKRGTFLSNATVTLDASGKGKITVANSTESTTYTLIKVELGNCEDTLNMPATVTINPKPVFASVDPDVTPLCGTSDASFIIEGTKGAIVTYKINGGGEQTATIDATLGEVKVTVSGATNDQNITITKVASATDATCVADLTGKTTTAKVEITEKPTAIIRKK